MGVPPVAGMLIGRDAELAALDLLCAQTADGAGGIVMPAGEPGVGKTRLAREAAGRAADQAAGRGGERGLVVSWGACRESEGAPPLWPWAQVLRRLGSAQLGSAQLGSAQLSADPGEDSSARFRLFERIGQVLLESAADLPHVVVIDDLHRADETSLRLLGYLGETLWPAPAGMIVTTATRRSPSLRRWHSRRTRPA